LFDDTPPLAPADRARLKAAGYVASPSYRGTWYPPGQTERRITTAEALAELEEKGRRPNDE
jgi:hypothetical protein